MFDLWTLIGVLVGLLVGWATPQPEWAKKFTAWMVQKYYDVKAKFTKDDFAP